MRSLYSLPCNWRVWLSAVLLFSGLTVQGQIGYIYDPAVGTTVLDPNQDDYISASGGAIDTSVVPDESYDFEIPFIPMFHLSMEPPADLLTGNDCGKSEIVDNPNLPMNAGYWYLADPDGLPGNGDEALLYRIRIATNVNGAYGYSFLIDTDNRIGFTGATADPNAVAGNPGFELEIIYGTAGSGTVSIMDVDGTTTGTTLSSYPGTSHSQRSWAGYTNCPLANNGPVFLDFFVPWDSLGILPTDTVRMIFATSSSANSALGGSASDIGGLNDNLYGDPDSSFIAITDSTPSFTFGGCGWAITQVGQQVSCYGDTDGWAWVDVWGGSPPVTFLWSTGSTNDTVYNLGAGTYEIYVTSGGGCMDTVTVTVTEPDSLVAQATVLDSILCFGDFNGSIAGWATGGTPPYTGYWSNGALSDTLTNLGQGYYTYYVTDANGCTDSIVVDMMNPLTPLAITTQSSTNILCFGDSSGTANLTITGGTPPYAVLWNDGNTDTSRAGLSGGTYEVVVTDHHGCQDSIEIVIEQPSQPVGGLTIAEAPVSCFGGADGVGVVVATGGTPPYTYLWSSGETNDTAFALPAGSQWVEVTDSVGCVDTLTVTILQPDTALAVAMTVNSQVNCFGGSDGSVTATVTGGTIPYSYLWNTGDTTVTINNLTAGTYSVVVTDANGCVDSATVIITQPLTPLAVTIVDSTDVMCFGDDNGTATANASGGTPPYDFEWSNGIIDSAATGLAGGTYTVVVTDANGCVDSASVTIQAPTAPLVASGAIINAILCNGDSDGAGYVGITGGTAPYSILWSNGATTDSLSGLTAGTYDVTVTDANGCVDTATFTLTEPAAIAFGANVTAHVLCFGDSTGAATTTVSGGVSPYTYLWSSGQTTASVTNLTAGTHTVVVTDANGCNDSVQVTITQPAAALVAGTSSTIGVTCKGDVDGEANATATGGTPPYTYAWSNGMTGPNISGLAGGNYILTVTDANGCQDTAMVNIFEPAFELLVGAADGTTITCNGGSDGTAYASATGGVPPYTFAWSNGMTGDTITGITAGTYIVTVTDSMGCTDTNTVVVTQPSLLDLNVSATMVTCFGQTDGSASATPSGGEAPYTYLWSTGATTSSVSALAAGTYYITVTDNRGCVNTDTVEITSPAMPLAAIISKTDVNCFGGTDGTATANGSGGVVPYTYLWSDGQTGQTATGLVPGSYYVIMTDANGCQDSAYVTIDQPLAALNGTATLLASPTCAGFLDGEAYITVSGGTAPYTYLWSNGSTNDTATGLGGGPAIVTVTDSNGCVFTDTVNIPPPSTDLEVTPSLLFAITCNGLADGELYATATGGTAPYTISWNSGHVGDTLVGVAAGTYYVTVVDSNGCTASASFVLGEPDTIAATTAVVQNVSCFGGADGEASVSAIGGTSPYTFAWSNGQTGATATGLPAGTHSVTVTDSNGCQAVVDVTITEPATAVTASAVMDVAVSCFGGADGQATASASGGTGSTYTYLWSDGQTGATATGLSAGTYTVIATDSLGCTDTASVIITQPASAVDVNPATIWAITCLGDTDGWATVSGSGGTAPYTYAWSNGQTGDSAYGLAAGSYVVTITDSLGCQDTVTVNIPAPAAALSANAIDAGTITCFGASDGTAYVTASGGWAPYTFLWGTGSTNDTITGLVAGNYSVTVTDSLGCSVVVDVTITQPTLLTGVTALVNNVSCFGGSDGSAFVTGSGGTAPYTYLWSNGETNDTAIALTAGAHTVTITDTNGCTVDVNVNITQPATAVSASATGLTQVLCFGDSTATARASASGGTPPYTYAWSHGQTTRTATGLWAGTHTVVVTDARGCVDSATVTISQPATPVDANAVMTQAVNCFGGNDGTASASATGGTAPYTYVWSNGVNGANTHTLSTGWYFVTVTDANGCQDTARVFITQPDTALGLAGGAIQHVTCFGGSDGVAYAGAFGGTAPYTYQWSDGQTTDTATGLSAGNYAVLVTDANGCQDLIQITITQPATDIFANALQATQASCYGGADGSAYVVVTNGFAPFTYLWSDGQTADTAIGLTAGTYTVTVTDSLGCTSTASITIAAPPQDIILITTVISNVSCIGGSDGVGHIFAQGGTAPYTYLWFDGQTTDTATGLPAGTHWVVVTDALGCLDTATITITEPASGVVASAAILFPVNCFGGSDGMAQASASGGTPPYTYVWDNGQTGAVASNLDTGVYVVTVIDANGCQDTASVIMTQPDSAVELNIVVLNNVRCLGGFDGQAMGTAIGGTPPYSFDWQHGASTALASGLIAGRYTVTVTDANGCQDSGSVWITEPATVLNASASVVNHVSCYLGADGSATVVATGGDAPYTYMWGNGQTSATAINLAAGTHSVTVTDSNGCVVTASVVITQPLSAVTASASVVSHVLCFGDSTGSASASASGGTPPYAYAWSNGATTASVSGLAAGTYAVVVTDANGCEDSASVTITQPASALSASSTIFNHVSCFGGSNAGFYIQYTGGTAPYSVLWNTGATSDTLLNMPAGTYTAAITDANGCVVGVSLTITQPASALAVNASVTANVLCFGDATGSANATASGGTSPYQFSWSHGANTASVSGLIAGTYVVTITDANGCFNTATVIITQPAAALAVSLLSSQNVNCFGNATGSATVDATGGTAPYTYAWNNGASTASITGLTAGSYTVTVTDANGCQDTTTVTITQPASALTATSAVINHVSCFGGNNGTGYVTYTGGTAPYTVSWNTGATSDTITNLVAGTYTATITDANGCVEIATITITQPSSALSASAAVTANVLCFGDATGSATVTANGGTSPYQYIWSNGATTASISGLTAGTYNVTVTDANGCTDTSSVTITQPSDALAIGLLASQAVNCFGGTDGSASVAVTGGTAPYSISWSNGSTGTSATNLAAGSYTAVVTDANGCVDSVSVLITQPATALTSAQTILSHVNCFGGNDGEAFITYSGGTAPYSVLWNTGATSDTISNLGAGTYTVNITDANGCVATQSVVITQPATPLTLSTNVLSHVNCFGGADGSATAVVSGGTSPYTYSWTNGSSTANATNLTAGTYTVTVTDANGCQASAMVTINQPTTALSASAGVLTHVNCFGDQTGAAAATAQGGTAPFTYLWSNGATTAQVNNLGAGVHTVTITDANGCTATDTITVNQPSSAIVAGTATTTDVLCAGGADGAATITVSGGTAPYTISWSGGQTGLSVTGLSAATHTVTITDANGCIATHTVVINEPSPLVMSASNSGDVNCFGGSDGFAQVTVSGGTAPYSVSWNHGATGYNVQNLAAGQYTATVTDANGCVDTVVFNITQPSSALTTAVGFIQNVSCFDGNDGVAYVQVTGGTQPYTIAWSTGSSSDTLSNLSAGSYTAIVTDANGCTDSITAVITEPSSAVTAGVTIQQNVFCKGEATGRAYVVYSGGTPPYSVLWSNGSTADSIVNVVAGTYTATITDANGCAASVTGTITEPAGGLAATASVIDEVLCYGGADGSARVQISGGTQPYTISWTGGQVSDTASGLTAGRYTVVVTDANGCVQVDSVDINGPSEPLYNTKDVVMVNCGGMNSGSITVNPAGGTPPYTVNWGHGSVGMTQSNLSVGQYPYTVIDGNGCLIHDTVNIQENPPIHTDFYVEPASCPTVADGYIELSSQGGTPPYTYLFNGRPFSGTMSEVPAGSHEITIRDAVGCDSTFFFDIPVEEDAMVVHIPNAFTPNDDRINERYKIYGSRCLTNTRFQIFDRWGNLVFSSHEPLDEFWDGTRGEGVKVTEDVYVWVFTSDQIEKRGHVVVIY